MTSPFPGMDPYLEGSLWTTLHHALATEFVRQLAPQIQPRYVALPVERHVIETIDDIAITTTDLNLDTAVVKTKQLHEAGVAYVAQPIPLQMKTVIPAKVPHVSLEIRDAAERQLVTAIEILSPTNKRGEGYKEYLQKRQRILATD